MIGFVYVAIYCYHNPLKRSAVQIGQENKKLIMDTEIANIFNKVNIKNIVNNTYKIFGAGQNAQKHKEEMYASVRCNELMEQGYVFKANAFENFGGINRQFQYICNDWMNLKIKDKEKVSMNINNWWIRFSVFFCRQMVKRVKNHYML